MTEVSEEKPAIASEEAEGKRRNSLERYRPGAYQNEERERWRRRAHFGEHRLSSTNGSRSRGKPRKNGNRGRFTNYRNGNGDKNGDKSGDENGCEKENDENEALATFSSVPISNWADDDPEDQIPLEELDKPNGNDAGGIVDLREKLNAMRMDGKPQKERNHPRVDNRKDNRRDGRKDNRGGNNHPKQKSNFSRPKKNTENFEPSHEPPEMRIIAAPSGIKRYNRPYLTRDVVYVGDLFGAEDDMTIYEKLLAEVQNSGVEAERLWQLWHGDSHVIADDKKKWKDACPTFHWIVEKLADYFNMDVKATRLNWYRDSSEWKPFHHDAAAIKEKMARTQNFTAAVSFGAERDAAFEHARTKTIISMPQPNGSCYTFGRDVNILWRHGIPQLPPEKQHKNGRISIIAWGWIEMEEA